MSRNKQRKYVPKSFESTGVSNDTSANVYNSMLHSRAFMSLKPRTKILYVYCKDQYYGKRKPSYDYPDIEAFKLNTCFYYNLDRAVKDGLYTINGNKEFYKDMETLEEHGLIELISTGRYNKSKSIYKFIDKWQTWNEGDIYKGKARQQIEQNKIKSKLLCG